MSKDQVLGFLLANREKPVSGEKIAAKLGISRNSVWKAVQALRTQGLVIDAATNAGYMLRSEGSALTRAAVMRHIGAASGLTVTVAGQVESTNMELKRQAEAGAAEGTVLIAEEQTGGKGRLGRSFYSPEQTGLYMSLLLRPDFAPEDAVFITVAAAVAVAQAMEAVAGVQAGIKWVNDIYVSGKKVCGILTEASMDFESAHLQYAVLGIGINVAEPQGGFPPEIAETAGALFPPDMVPEGLKAKLAGEILTRFMAMYRRLRERPFLEEYRRRSILTDCRITFTQGAVRESGHVVGISEKAELIVRLDDGGLRKYSSGEAAIEKEALQKILKNQTGEAR